MTDSKPHKGRAIAVPVLIAVASLLAVLSATSVWVKKQALDTDAWVKASSDVLANKDVQQLLSTYVVDQLYQNVDVAGALQQRLPSDLASLAGPIAAAVRAPAAEAVERLLASPKAQRLWEQANRRAHAALVRVLENKTRVGSTEEGVVSLNIAQLLTTIGQELGLPPAIVDKVPADAGEIVLIRSDRLHRAQQVVRAIRVLSALLLIVVVGLYTLAVVLARDRRKTIRNIGWAVTASAVLLLVIRRAVLRYVLSIVGTQYEHAGRATLLIGTSLLRQLALAGVAYGLSVVAWAFVAGPTRAGRAIRRLLAPALNGPPVAVAAGAAALFLLLVAWSPAPNPQSGLRMLILAVLYTLGVISLRRRTTVEFEGIRWDDIADGFVQAYRRATGRFRPGSPDGNGLVTIDVDSAVTPAHPDELITKA